MATLAELMYQNASNTINQTNPDLAGSIQAGAQLGLKMQQLEQESVKLKQTAEDARNKAIGGTLKIIETSQKFKSEADKKRFLKGALPGAVQAYNTGDVFTPEMQDMLINSGDAQRAVSMIISKVRDNSMTQSEAVQMLNIAGLGDAIEMSSMEDAEKFRLQEIGKTKRAEIMAQSQTQRQQTQIQADVEKRQQEFARTTGKTVKTAIGKDFGQYQLTGGKAALEQNAVDLQDAIKKLKSGELSTGGISTKLPYLKSDDVQSMLNQEMLNVEVAARKAIMPLLRATLGAQFTEQEGERIFGTVFDRKAPAAENARRMEAKLKELKQTIVNKEDAFLQEGLIKPEQRTQFGSANKPANKETMSKAQNIWNAKSPEEQQAYADRVGLTIDQVKQKLGVK